MNVFPEAFTKTQCRPSDFTHCQTGERILLWRWELGRELDIARLQHSQRNCNQRAPCSRCEGSPIVLARHRHSVSFPFDTFDHRVELNGYSKVLNLPVKKINQPTVPLRNAERAMAFDLFVGLRRFDERLNADSFR